jgi:hypothetical protein
VSNDFFLLKFAAIFPHVSPRLPPRPHSPAAEITHPHGNICRKINETAFADPATKYFSFVFSNS